MLTVSAQWIVPVTAPPIQKGFLTIDDDGHIAAVGQGSPAGAVSLGPVAVLPALVNPHTHLELSYLQGRVPPSESFNDWVTALMSSRRTLGPDPNAPEIIEHATRAIEHSRAAGTGLIGDISNTLVTVDLLRDARMPAHVFYEQIGFNLPDVGAKVAQARAALAASGRSVQAPPRPRHRTDHFIRDVRITLAPHAPYSVSPALFTAIRAAVNEDAPAVTSVHLGESAQEVQFLRDGTGPFRALLERLGVWTDAWTPPAASPVAYLDALGFLDARTLVVHGVQFGVADLDRLRSIGATLVSCPRSNVWVGAGSPPLDAFYDAGVTVALATDSLASVADLSMFNELAEARRIAPRVPARRLLESATLIGARALGFEREFGSLEVGKRAAIVTVTLPSRLIDDVEEYLVGGVEPGAIEWFAPAS